MEHPTPAPPALGERDGLAYALFLPEGVPACGVVICHGAGSAKESHFDFARAARAHGMAALAFDARGHGRTGGRFGASALDDVVAMADLLREQGASAVAFRGSSMGGFLAIQAGARDPGTLAVVAICPAPEDMLMRGLRQDRFEFEADTRALEPWLLEHPLREAAASLGPGTPLLLLHAKGDEQIPWTVSQELYDAAAEPKRLLLVPGGHHRSLQHDGEMQAASIHWIERALASRY
jgi:alpha-beta hydrolase superfamily lysophospholipase